MTWRAAEPTNQRNIPVGSNYIRQNWEAIQAVCKLTRLNDGTPIPDYVPSGTDMWIYADSAPTGWTIQNSLGDTLLAVKGGSTYTTGADSAGTWTQPDHTLTEAEIPAHTHTLSPLTTGLNQRGVADTTCYRFATGTLTSSSYGGGGAHNHGDTYRPLARVGIIARKD